MHHESVLRELMTRSAEEIRRQLVGFACRHPEELRAAGASIAVQVIGTQLFVPVMQQPGVPLVGGAIGFGPDEDSGLRLFEVEADEVLYLLEAHGLGTRAAVTWAADGFHGHLEVWSPTGGVPEALVALRGFFDDCWPAVGAEVTVEVPRPGSGKDITMVTWGDPEQGSGQVGVICDDPQVMAARVTAAQDAARAALLELFEGTDPVADPDGALRFTTEIAAMSITVDVADAADWRVHRA